MSLAYEHSDDPRVYRAERARADEARALCALLVRATGAVFEAVHVDPDRSAARAAALEHFAAIARDGLAAWPGRWAPSRLFLRAIEQRGLSWPEVEAAARCWHCRAVPGLTLLEGLCEPCSDARTSDEHESDQQCDCDACGRVASRYARLAREASPMRGLAPWAHEVLGPGWLDE